MTSCGKIRFVKQTTYTQITVLSACRTIMLKITNYAQNYAPHNRMILLCLIYSRSCCVNVDICKCLMNMQSVCWCVKVDICKCLMNMYTMCAGVLSWTYVHV